MPVTEVFNNDEFESYVYDKNEEKNGPKHGKKHIVIDFFATWCGPCKKFAPVYEKLSEEYNDCAEFIKINIEKFDDLIGEYSITALPTFIILDTGKKESPYKPIIGTTGNQLKNKLESLCKDIEISDDF